VKRVKFLMMFLGMCAATAAVLGLYLIRTDSSMVQVQAQELPSPSPSASPVPSPSPVPTPTPSGSNCTPGFWKNNAVNQAAAAWVTFSPGETLLAAGINTSGLIDESTTLLQALNFGGGSGLVGAAQNLLRAAVASLLNAAAFGGGTAAETAIVAEVNAALASGSRDTIINLANTLDAGNNSGTCTLSMSGSF
jgi:hypothetical protein